MKQLLAAALVCLPLAAADYRVGIARIDITPTESIWLSGYASRKKPSEGVSQKLWAKALAFEDAKGKRLVIVTTDLIGLPRVIADTVGATVEKEHRLERSRLLLNSSHTHSGPVVRPNLLTMYALDEHNQSVLKAYARKLTGDLTTVIGGAIADLKPANVAYGTGQAGFAINRREPTPKGVRIGLNPPGVTDHSVPVIRVSGEDGKTRAVLFGYACHNTTLGGDIYEVNGDYAGFAQAAFEQENPGVTGLFLMLCGGDQNPNPRGKVENAEQHGKTLAAEVNRVLSGALTPVRGEIKSAFTITDLPLAPHERETFEKMKSDSNPVKVRLAESILKQYDERRPPRFVQYPVQAVRFGKDLLLLALGGEVVVDYALRAKREFGNERLIVAGYSNDVMCYIPSKRVLSEGGYEAVDSMMYYGMPGPFSPEVEETVFKAIRRVVGRVR